MPSVLFLLLRPVHRSRPVKDLDSEVPEDVDGVAPAVEAWILASAGRTQAVVHVTCWRSYSVENVVFRRRDSYLPQMEMVAVHSEGLRLVAQQDRSCLVSEAMAANASDVRVKRSCCSPDSDMRIRMRWSILIAD